MDEERTGSCLCGAVTYTVTGLPTIVAQCHCNACRRQSGTGHSIGAMYPASAVSVAGKLHNYNYTSDNGSVVTKAFCANCGSPIYGKNTRAPDFLTLTLGTMDHADPLQVEVVIFARDQPHWDTLGPDVVSFATQPDWEPKA